MSTHRSLPLQGVTRMPQNPSLVTRAFLQMRKLYRSSPLSAISLLGWLMGAARVLCLVTFRAFGWHEMLAIGLFLLTSLLIAVLMSLGNTGFHASMAMNQRRVNVGDDVDVEVTVDNPSRTPTAVSFADLPLGLDHERFTIPMLAPRQSKQTSVAFRALSRAVLTIGPLTIRKGDPFGLIRRERTMAQQMTLFVHPAIERLNPLHAGLIRDLEGQHSEHIVDDDLDFYGLREYQPGDDVRHVHWLSSSKNDTMMVRQYQATRRTEMSITLDVNPSDYLTAAEFEMAVSAHASIGVQCLGEDRPLTDHTGSSHRQHHDVTTFLDACSGIQPIGPDSTNLAEATLLHSPQASYYCFTIGSQQSLDNIKRMTFALPRSAVCVVVQTQPGSRRWVHPFPNFTLVSIGKLSDLPGVMEAIS